MTSREIVRVCIITAPPFSRCQPQYSQCLVQTILRYQPYPFQESWYLVTYTLTLSTKHLYQLIWLPWADTGETQTQSQYLSVQLLVFFVLFIHLKVHLCFGDGHCTINGRSRGDQFTGGGQCYRACQIKEQAIKPFSSYYLPCNSIISQWITLLIFYMKFIFNFYPQKKTLIQNRFLNQSHYYEWIYTTFVVIYLRNPVQYLVPPSKVPHQCSLAEPETFWPSTGGHGKPL